jgi:hypothetical protein
MVDSVAPSLRLQPMKELPWSHGSVPYYRLFYPLAQHGVKPQRLQALLSSGAVQLTVDLQRYSCMDLL